MRFERDRGRPTTDAKETAEAAFRKITTKPIEGSTPKLSVPGAKDVVSLRIDQDVLEHFQAEGPGWQDRISAALRKAAGL